MTPAEPVHFDYTSYEKTAPAVVDALRAMGKAVDDSGLEKPLTELLKIRVAQLNGCAFCLQLHLNVARKCGLAPAKVDLVATWRDVDLFSPRERAALAWADALTMMARQAIPEACLGELQAHFSREEIAFLTAAISNINAWNRIAGALRFPVPAG